MSLYRNRSGAKKIMESAIREGFTDVIIINEDMSKPSILFLLLSLWFKIKFLMYNFSLTVVP